MGIWDAHRVAADLIAGGRIQRFEPKIEQDKMQP
jgi:hypothetical protein